MTRRYVWAIADIIGPDRDVPAPDMNTNEQTMAWVMDTYSMQRGRIVTGVVTGKPVGLGGSLGRRTATGFGVEFVTRAALAKWKISDPKKTNVVIQGSGNVGASRPSASTSSATRSSASPTSTAASTTARGSTSPR